MSKEEIYPKMFDSLPDADIPYRGIGAKLLQGIEHQVIFFDVKEEAFIPAHRHSAQWGVVLQGEMEVEMQGNRRKFKKGESYFIPDGIEHSVRLSKGFKAVDIFFEKERYCTKS
ncbi:MAG: cupin domain-containing protein [Candidatus Schekmanbacteria bacterium]|nr:MAG: cupin domain-containing protein [Candidatus Schekmanbacteria bacterium]